MLRAMAWAISRLKNLGSEKLDDVFNSGYVRTELRRVRIADINLPRQIRADVFEIRACHLTTTTALFKVFVIILSSPASIPAMNCDEVDACLMLGVDAQ